MPLTDNTRDARHQSSVQFRLHRPVFPDVPLGSPNWRDNYQVEGAETQGEEGTTQTKYPRPPTQHSRGLASKEGPDKRREQQNNLPSSTPPPTTIRQASGRRMLIQSPGRWSARPRTSTNQPERADVQEPTMHGRPSGRKSQQAHQEPPRPCSSKDKQKSACAT